MLLSYILFTTCKFYFSFVWLYLLFSVFVISLFFFSHFLNPLNIVPQSLLFHSSIFFFSFIFFSFCFSSALNLNILHLCFNTFIFYYLFSKIYVKFLYFAFSICIEYLSRTICLL